MPASVSNNEKINQYYTTAVDALYEIGRAHYNGGVESKARHLLYTSLQLLEASEQPKLRLKLLLLYGQVLIVEYLLSRGAGDADPLFSALAEARQLAEVTREQQGLADALSLLGLSHYFTTVMGGAVLDSPQSGKYDKALAYQQQALELREALHDTRGISESYFQIGVIHERWQQYEESEAYYTKALQLADQYGHLFEKTEPSRHFAIHALHRGELDQALSLALQALKLREEAGFKPYQPLDHLLLSEVYQAKGDTTNAQQHSERASVLAEEMGYPTLVSGMLSVRERLNAQPR